MKSKEEVIEQIRKLLNHAAGAGHHSQGEIESALNVARKLMEKYNVDDADLLSRPAEVIDDSMDKVAAYSRAGTNGIEKYFIRMAHVCDLICGVKHFYGVRYHPDGQPDKPYLDRKGRTQPRQTLYFYGFKRDIAVAAALYTELMATQRAIMQFRYPKDWRDMHWSHGPGFVERLIERAMEFKGQSVAESNTTAIVIRKDDHIRRWAESNLSLVTGRSRATTIRNHGAYQAGRNDANNVSLGTNQIRQAPRGLLS